MQFSCVKKGSAQFSAVSLLVKKQPHEFQDMLNYNNTS